MNRAWRACVALAFALAFASPRLEAQCAPPDGLDGGPCCASATLTHPRPKFNQQALGICWQGCNIAAVNTYQAQWGGLQPGIGPGTSAPCGWYWVPVQLFTGSTLRWTGRLQVTYARTWIETMPSGNTYQVWRFLVNGDMQATPAAGPIPCPVPPCAPAFNNRVRFTGYVDYARNCGTNLIETAWMLTHSCDAIDHDLGFPRGGNFHPDRAYTFVGPAAGFAPGPLQPTEAGGTGFESLRRWKVPVPGTTGPVTCEFEEPVATAAMSAQNALCLCGPGANPQYYLASLFIAGSCGTTVQSLAGALPYTSMGIGAWTNPNAYPGIEALRWNTGFYSYSDPCIGVVTTEFFFGATTIGGFPATQYLSSGPGAPLPQTFVDQCNSMLFPGSLPVHNVPFQSDHIFSLNLP